MGDVVDLHGQPAGLEDDPDFISDLARFAEGIFSEQDVKKKHHLSADTWERLGNNETLIEKIEAEKVRRVRTGASKRERAQQLVMKAPNILDSIMSDTAAESAAQGRRNQNTGCVCQQRTGNRAGVGSVSNYHQFRQRHLKV